jgi:hypothetical protein
VENMIFANCGLSNNFVHILANHMDVEGGGQNLVVINLANNNITADTAPDLSFVTSH